MIDDEEVTTVVVAKNSSEQFEKQVTINDLSGNYYYIRAYCKSIAGVSYGDIKQIYQDPYLGLPTFEHNGYLYRAYPTFNYKMPQDRAQSACNNLTYGGYSDWVLPNKAELNTMYANKNALGFESTNDCVVWWSREYKGRESYYYYYWAQYFYTNSSHNEGYQLGWEENRELNVRCIRTEKRL